MEKQLRYILLTLLLCVLLVTSASASSRLVTISIERDFQHLGDNVEVGALIPEPEGTVWKKSFRVSSRLLRHAKDAHIQVVLWDVGFSAMTINGKTFTLPVQGRGGIDILVLPPRLLSIPVGILRAG